MFKKIVEKLYWRNHKPDWDSAYFPAEATDALFAELSKVEGFADFLRILLKADRIRYFNANDEKTRDIIKGEYTRTLYILKSVRSETDEAKVINQKVSGRYGS